MVTSWLRKLGRQADELLQRTELGPTARGSLIEKAGLVKNLADRIDAGEHWT